MFVLILPIIPWRKYHFHHFTDEQSNTIGSRFRNCTAAEGRSSTRRFDSWSLKPHRVITAKWSRVVPTWHVQPEFLPPPVSHLHDDPSLSFPCLEEAGAYNAEVKSIIICCIALNKKWGLFPIFIYYLCPFTTAHHYSTIYWARTMEHTQCSMLGLTSSWSQSPRSRHSLCPIL